MIACALQGVLMHAAASAAGKAVAAPYKTKDSDKKMLAADWRAIKRLSDVPKACSGAYQALLAQPCFEGRILTGKTVQNTGGVEARVLLEESALLRQMIALVSYYAYTKLGSKRGEDRIKAFSKEEALTSSGKPLDKPGLTLLTSYASYYSAVDFENACEAVVAPLCGGWTKASYKDYRPGPGPNPKYWEFLVKYTDSSCGQSLMSDLAQYMKVGEAMICGDLSIAGDNQEPTRIMYAWVEKARYKEVASVFQFPEW